MSEQDALDQTIGNRAAIDGDEGFAAAVAGALDGARHIFLAGPRLTLDQNGNVRCRRFFGETQRPRHRLAVGRKILEARQSRAPARLARNLLADGAYLHGVADGLGEALGRCGLDDKVECPVAHGGDDGLHATLRGLHDDRGVKVALAHLLQHRQPVGARHNQIQDDNGDILAVAFEGGKPGIAAIGNHRRMAESRYSRLQQAALHGIVIDNEYGTRHGLAEPSSGEGRAIFACPTSRSL